MHLCFVATNVSINNNFLVAFLVLIHSEMTRGGRGRTVGSVSFCERRLVHILSWKNNFPLPLIQIDLVVGNNDEIKLTK